MNFVAADVNFVESKRTVAELSSGQDCFVKYRNGKVFTWVYQLFAEKNGRCDCCYFRPDYPKIEAIKFMLFRLLKN